MSDYAVIPQNVEAMWLLLSHFYTFPSTYKAILTPGCRVIYYKANTENAAFAPFRLSLSAHYFGIGVIGDSIIAPPDAPRKYESHCEILEYQEFEEAVLIKEVDNYLDPVPESKRSEVGVLIKEVDNYLDPVPESKRSNYWRFAVREISKATYARILIKAKITEYPVELPSQHNELESFLPLEGEKRARFSSVYEWDPSYRSKAIEIHGLICMACDFNFEEKYGALGMGFIQVHHNKPISESEPTRINPKTDMSVLCPNCHAMIHRKKDKTLTVEELRKIIQK